MVFFAFEVVVVFFVEGFLLVAFSLAFFFVVVFFVGLLSSSSVERTVFDFVDFFGNS